MIFLKSKDFNSIIKDNLLADAVGSSTISADNQILCNVENKAIQLIKSYIKDVYDLDFMFSASEADRDLMLIDMIVNIMVYYLSRRMTIDMVAEARESAYKETIQMLKDIRDGKINPEGWPRKNANFDFVNKNLYHSEGKSNYNWDY